MNMVYALRPLRSTNFAVLLPPALMDRSVEPPISNSALILLPQRVHDGMIPDQKCIRQIMLNPPLFRLIQLLVEKS